MTGNKEKNPGRSPLDWPLEAGEADAVLGEIGRLRRIRRTWRRRTAVLTLAGVALIVGSWGWLHFGALRSESPLAGQALRRELPDGSLVELKLAAEIAVDYSDAMRNVALLRGAAHFKVAKNLSRPFVVRAGGVEVRAVGTEFEVDLGRTSVEIAVDEGRVAVEQAGAGDHAVATYVSAGNRVVVDLPSSPPAGSAPSVVAGPGRELEGRLAPRVPRMDLAATPLSEVVPVFNQYSGKRLVLADPELGAVQLSGVLRADNVDALLKLLETNYGIKPETRGDEIILGRAP